MLKKIDHTTLGTAYHTWLQSLFHFSFADYYQPVNKKFGVLRVINDDIMHPSGGHDLHKHREVEILTYIIEGELTHTFKGGVPKQLSKGDMYYLSAGTGIEHGEFNWGSHSVRMLQIWMVPQIKKQNPSVIYTSVNEQQLQNKWLQVAANVKGHAVFNVNQDVNMYIAKLEQNNKLFFEMKKGRQAYLIQISGQSIINEINLFDRDGLEIDEESIMIYSETDSHLLLIEMKKD